MEPQETINFINVATQIVNSASALAIALVAASSSLIGLCSVIAAFTPPPDPNSRFYYILKPLDTIINHIAFNVKNAKNARDT